MKDDAAVRRYLESRGCGDAVVRGGLPYLLNCWRQIAESLRRSYDWGLDDYLNDMDVRQIIADVRAKLPGGEQEEAAIDAEIRPLLTPARRCIWGTSNAEKHGWTADRNWWYFTHPRHMGDALRGDLAQRHLLADPDSR